MSKKLLLVMNPCAGQKKSNKYLTDILNIFSINGYECTVQMTSLSLSAYEIVKKYGKEKDLIVCIGGDGTFNETVSGLLDLNSNAKLGYIPSGSTNDFATSMGLSLNPVKATEDIVYGTVKTIDIGLFNSRPFTYVASFGAFTKTSYNTPRDLKNMLGHLAYILEGIKELADIKSYTVSFETEEKKVYSGKYLFGAICNTTRVGGGMIRIPKDIVDINDGVFEVVLVKAPENPAEYMQLILDLQASKVNGSQFEFFSAKKLTVSADESMDWTLDGEYEKGCESIEIINLHSRISLCTKNTYLPEEKQG